MKTTQDSNEKTFGTRERRAAESYARSLRAQGLDYYVQTLETGRYRVQLHVDPFAAFEGV